MKKIFTLLFVIVLAQPVFAQNPKEAFKVAEFETPGAGCDEYFRTVYLLEEMEKYEGSRGLIVVYSGDNKKRFGSVLAYVSGAKKYLPTWMRIPTDKISFVIAEGKNLFNKEFWLVPKGAKFPDIKPFEFDWSKLKEKYYFSYTCLDCEPDYPFLSFSQPGLEEYTEVLKKNDNFQGVIEIYMKNYGTQKERLKEAQKYAAEYRQMLTKDYRVDNEQITIRLKKSTETESTATANLYIVPKISENKK